MFYQCPSKMSCQMSCMSCRMSCQMSCIFFWPDILAGHAGQWQLICEQQLDADSSKKNIELWTPSIPMNFMNFLIKKRKKIQFFSDFKMDCIKLFWRAIPLQKNILKKFSPLHRSSEQFPAIRFEIGEKLCNFYG